MLNKRSISILSAMIFSFLLSLAVMMRQKPRDLMPVVLDATPTEPANEFGYTHNTTRPSSSPAHSETVKAPVVQSQSATTPDRTVVDATLGPLPVSVDFSTDRNRKNIAGYIRNDTAVSIPVTISLVTFATRETLSEIEYALAPQERRSFTFNRSPDLDQEVKLVLRSPQFAELERPIP